MQRRHALIVERHLAAHEHIQHDPETPHIDFWPSVEPRVEQLRRGKVERSAERRQLGRRRKQVGQTKVDDLDVARVGDEDVLDLEIWWKRDEREKEGELRSVSSVLAAVADSPRCTIEFLWQYSNALPICLENFLAALSLSRPWEMM